MRSPLRTLLLTLVFLWFAIGGIAHFALVDTFASIVPAYVPHPIGVVYVSGVFELLGAIGLLLPATRRAAGVGLMFLTVAVTPANVFMWQHADRFSHVAEWVLFWRLPFQLLVLAAIAYGSGLWREYRA
jgi:uncharacterized membrane protein